MDFKILLAHVFPDEPVETWHAFPDSEGIVKRMAWVGVWLAEQAKTESFQALAQHPSDTVRGWVAYALCHHAEKNPAKTESVLEACLPSLKPLADDGHFGVREWTWLAVRPQLCACPEEAIALLSSWTTSPSENLRRFASEATRPRGVWCAHMPLLKKRPELGLPILTPLAKDPSRYVQDSVANWLNDAGKSQPEWVKDLCHLWISQHEQNFATHYIVKRALRNLK